MAVDPREIKAYLNATPMQRETVRSALAEVLAVLQAQSLSYQTSHWQTVGASFYGNHLLFERLYGSVLEQIDQLAEKMVGYLGRESVDIAPRILKIASLVEYWGQIECPHERGLLSESELQACVKSAYDQIKSVKAMTLGLDDWLMAVANAHEENTYLLQQVLESPPGAKTAGRDYLVKSFKRENGVLTTEEVVAKNWAAVKRAVAQAHRQGMDGYVIHPDGGKSYFHEVRSSGMPTPHYGAEAPSAEGHFFDNPEKREVLEFAESGALTNLPEVASEASDEDQLDISETVAVAEAEDAPPSPSEIVKEPGGKELSTLNRYEVAASDHLALENWFGDTSAE